MIFVLSTGTSVYAQDIESLVMPGAVIEGHAEYETECASCHKKFRKSGQRQLCMDCHEEIADDISSRSGYHGKFSDARDEQCAECHSEHLGRDADIVNLDESAFDHRYTDYEISGAHEEAECADCHKPGVRHRDAPGTCFGCHEDDDNHQETMGTECDKCHQPTDWQDVEFDHDSTNFPLIGKHRQAACLDCHEDATFPAPPDNCYGCHKDDDAHDGRSGNECENCHNPTGWDDTSFNHTRDTDFPLQGRHARLSCDDCHSDDPFSDQMDMACVSCHLEDDVHEAHRGTECDSCHDNNSWEEPTFDHDRDTEYELRGAHREVECNDCHIDPVFEAQLNTTCESCHLDDDAHDGSLGTQCENCHTVVSWEDPVFFDHDLTRFPLLGKHKDNDCKDCHETQAFAETESDCGVCHRDDNPHEGNFPENCDSCHNPVGWELWSFDHNAQTEFPLDGAHLEVACELCHRIPLEKIKTIDGSCRNCHRADDVHDGEFGADCGRCHSAETFTEVRSLQ